jgi:hypothetical protein
MPHRPEKPFAYNSPIRGGSLRELLHGVRACARGSLLDIAEAAAMGEEKQRRAMTEGALSEASGGPWRVIIGVE